MNKTGIVFKIFITSIWWQKNQTFPVSSTVLIHVNALAVLPTTAFVPSVQVSI